MCCLRGTCCRHIKNSIIYYSGLTIDIVYCNTGMTMGMLSLDTLKLRVKASVGTDSERLAAKKYICC